MMLAVQLMRDGAPLGEWQVLNEAVISRGRYARSVRLRAELDGRHWTTYVADGLICATATGSTAYALAAGGPILPPELNNILLLPVAPHLSVDRAIVLAEGTVVTVTVYTDHEAMLSADGQAPTELADGDQIDVRAGRHRVSFARTRDKDYFYRNLTSRMHTNPSANYRP
ncbi:MAG: NAD(+)/NADH kinase [Chloroflexi bacterium]|nr:NAD(+)/NADH kinase [Chloroflexota bacterium]